MTWTGADLITFTHLRARCRKEEKKTRPGFWQVADQDESILALRKKLEEKQQERQRQKQPHSNKAAAHTPGNTGTLESVSMTSTTKAAAALCDSVSGGLCRTHCSNSYPSLVFSFCLVL